MLLGQVPCTAMLFSWIAQIPAPVFVLVTVVAWLGCGMYLRAIARGGRR